MLLSNLLCKISIFKFGPDQRHILHMLHYLFTSDKVLHTFMLGSDCEVYTDISNYNFGAVLMQKYGSTFAKSIDGHFHQFNILYEIKKKKKNHIRKKI